MGKAGAVQGGGAETDEDLARAAQAGDEAALGQLLERYRVPLEALHLQGIPPALRSKISVADLLQETWAAVWRDLGAFRYKGPGSFRAWLQQVARNRMLDAVRRYRTERRAVVREVPRGDRTRAPELPGRDPSPSSLAVAKEMEDRLRLALPSLPPDQQTVLRFVLVEGLSMAEVGKRMHRSPNAAQKLYARAKDALWKRCAAGGA